MTSRRAFLGLMSAGTAGCLGTIDESPHSNLVNSVQIPSEPTNLDYPVMGTGHNQKVTYVASWNCIFSATVSQEILPIIVDRNIVPDKLDLEFRALTYKNGRPFLGTDAPENTSAGLAVWDEAPHIFWEYHQRAFSSRKQGNEEHKAGADLIQESLSQKDSSDIEPILETFETQSFDARMEATSEYAMKRDIQHVPKFCIGETIINPLADRDETIELLEDFSS